MAIAGAFGLALAITPVSAVIDGVGVRLILNHALAQGGPPEGRGGGRPEDVRGAPENAGGGKPEGVGGPPADRGPGDETRGGEQLAAARERYQSIFGGEDDGTPEDEPGDPEVTLPQRPAKSRCTDHPIPFHPGRQSQPCVGCPVYPQ